MSDVLVWCSCGEYRAQAHQRLCPICLDRARKDPK